MPPNLPDETWIHIIELRPMEYFPNTRRFARNLGLTCKRLHQIATPFVYRKLGFCVDFTEDEDRPFERTMTGIIQDMTRAQSLLRLPHLLRHVRQLTLWDWDDTVSRTVISAYYFSPGANWPWDINHVNTKDAGNMVSVIYDLITRLILHMPGLQELMMAPSTMTPLLYAAICSLPRLTSFDFSVYRSDVIHEQSGPIGLPPTLHIRNIRYYTTQANGYLSNILAASIMSLHKLSISSSNLPLVSSYICNGAFPLKTLKVDFYDQASPDRDAQIALWDTLRATPELRTLLIRGYGLDVPPPDDLCNHLRKLYQLYAPPQTIRNLAKGMELDAIEISGTLRINEQTTITQSVPCSPTRLRVLILRAVKPITQQDLDKFIDIFHVFQNLEYLDIHHEFPDIPATDVDFHESLKVIKNLWRKLKHLRRFNLSDYNPLVYPNEEPYGIEAACPLDIHDELLPRGHPTLERIGLSFMRRSLWRWHPKDGWVSGRWSFEVWYDESYVSWSQF